MRSTEARRDADGSKESIPARLCDPYTEEKFTFPLAGLTWQCFSGRPEVCGADDGPPGRGGWHHQRNTTHVHQGIDLKAAVGHPVVAVEGGVAVYRGACSTSDQGSFNAAGNRVCLIGSSGQAFLYFHLGTDNETTHDAFPANVLSGHERRVEVGEVLGYTGHSGGSRASGLLMPFQCAHLHFEHRPGGPTGADVNPARLFERIT
jgi:murein DD-endopeptidase MepM/ murein hydrolase activator NlpD